MKITVTEISKEKSEEIVVYCYEENKEHMLDIANRFQEQIGYIVCKKDGNTYKVSLNDVLYVEVVDERLYIYSESDVYENRMRLYEVENLCPLNMFFRASKSMLVNIDQIAYVKPSISGRFEITMRNSERLLVSRKYVNELKRIMGV